MPSLNLTIGEYIIYTQDRRQNSIMCISHIDSCDRYRSTHVQNLPRAAARHSARTAHDVVASASAAKFSPKRQATIKTKSEMK
eukprot:4955600-Pleurochrysis_carterae.AAC.2